KALERDASSEPENARRRPGDVAVEVRVLRVRVRVRPVLAGLARRREDRVAAAGRRAEDLVARRDALEVRDVEDVEERSDRDGSQPQAVLEVQVDVVRGGQRVEAAASDQVPLLAVAGTRIATDRHRTTVLVRGVDRGHETEVERVRTRELELVR